MKVQESDMVEDTTRAVDGAVTEPDGRVATNERFEVGPDRSVGLAVVEALAETRGVSPTEMNPPLWNVVDLEALDGLFDGGSNDCRVTFSVDDALVTVTGDMVHVRID